MKKVILDHTKKTWDLAKDQENMTKKEIAQELKEEFTKGNFKPSQLKRSKSLDNIPTTSLPITPLQKSKSQLEIPLTNQPSKDQQITQLKQTLTFTQTTAQNYLQSLQLAQAKITELEEKDNKFKEKISQLEDQILQLRLDKIKEFGDYLEKKEELSQELELNINEGVQEIKKLENKLLATNKKKLELQQKLSQEQLKNTRLELQLINDEESLPSFNYWPLITIALLAGLAIWIFNQPE